jgi:hypothetical protein
MAAYEGRSTLRGTKARTDRFRTQTTTWGNPPGPWSVTPATDRRAYPRVGLRAGPLDRSIPLRLGRGPPGASGSPGLGGGQATVFPPRGDLRVPSAIAVLRRSAAACGGRGGLVAAWVLAPVPCVAAGLLSPLTAGASLMPGTKSRLIRSVRSAWPEAGPQGRAGSIGNRAVRPPLPWSLVARDNSDSRREVGHDRRNSAR